MELALYHPERGYYASGRANIGRQRRFFTNVSVGSALRKIAVASQFAEIWEKLGRPRDFKIVEQGAHDGVFAADALSALRRSAGDCFAATSYCMIEPFPIWRERQQKICASSPEKLPGLPRLTKSRRSSEFIFPTNCSIPCRCTLIVSGGVANGATVWNENSSPWNTGFQPVRPAELNSAVPDAPSICYQPNVSRSDLQLDHLGFFPAGFGNGSEFRCARN